MNNLNILERKFLQELRNLAFGMAQNNLNVDFSRAYVELGMAIDRLDAMHARIDLDSRSTCRTTIDTPK